MHILRRILFPLFFLSFLPFVTNAQIAFEEDWESGSIHNGKWRVKQAPGCLVQIEDLNGDGSDHALAIWSGTDTNFWTTAVRSVVEFARESKPKVTASIWGDPSRTNGTFTYPTGAGWMLGFHQSTDNNLPPYTQIEAVLDDWYAPTFGNNRLRFTQPPSHSVFEGDGSGYLLSQDFMNAIFSATSKAHSVRIRIGLGEVQGGSFEWWNPQSNSWVNEVSTAGISGGTSSLVTLAFAPVGACVFVDDISVEGQAVFREDWQTQQIDPAKWKFHNQALTGTVLQVEKASGTQDDYALAMYGGGWPISVKSNIGFKRNQPLVVQATLWGDPSRTDGTNTYPEGCGWVFGFHNIGIPTKYAFEDCEAVLDHWYTTKHNNTRFTYTQVPQKSVFLGGSVQPQLSQEFTDAIVGATSKNKAVQIRITLDPIIGSKYEWYDSIQQQWITEVDTLGTSGTTRQLLKLGFGPAAANVYLDDIEVRGSMEIFPSETPEGFTTFDFGNHPREQQLLSNFMAYHYLNRLERNSGICLFNKEYCTVADMWLNNAQSLEGQPIQQSYRGFFVTTGIGSDGYVHTNQHFSHSHEWGWPFPLWTQSGIGPAGIAGLTVGWHFQDNPLFWTGDYLRGWGDTRFFTAAARNGWTLINLVDEGIVDNKWHLRANGTSPALVTPTWMKIDVFNAPFLQLRWKRTGTPIPMMNPSIQWMREEDADFSSEREIFFTMNGNPGYEAISGTRHSLIQMDRHPFWKGTIKSIRINLAPNEGDVQFDIDSFFTVYDTRHQINNPIFLLGCWEYYRWTGDVPFLAQNIQRMRSALRYIQTEFKPVENGFLKIPWTGHDGKPGITYSPGKTLHPGHGVGGTYWDILPFGANDMYTTSLYHRAVLVMASMEEMIINHPEWNIPASSLAFNPASLRSHANQIVETVNQTFWNPENKRFYAAMDVDGQKWDYGFTFVNLESIWYGTASPEHARQIMSWINGDRIVPTDTAQGVDIYHWRFAPRTTTRRNIEWYAFPWSAPESISFGDQIQDGGAVLGFTFFDLYARLKVLGPDNAWNRLVEILDWEEEVQSTGGYRKYYESHEGTMQGGGPPGGIGIDFEFYETSMLPAIIPYGFLGLEPDGESLTIHPSIPTRVSSIGIRDLKYHSLVMDVSATNKSINLKIKSVPVKPMVVRFKEDRRLVGQDLIQTFFTLREPGSYSFELVNPPSAQGWMVN